MPLECKNTYNNVPISKSNLYNIYFQIINIKLTMPELIQHLFLCDFNLRLFLTENEYLIREYAINKYLTNTSTNIL